MHATAFIYNCVCMCVRERETISYIFPSLGKIRTRIQVPFPHWTATPKMQGKEDQTNKGVWGESRHCQVEDDLLHCRAQLECSWQQIHRSFMGRGGIRSRSSSSGSRSRL